MVKHLTSCLKSLTWRITGVLILAIITYIYTRHWLQATQITLLHHGIFLILFYLHERFWLHVDYLGLTRSVLKCITYETILGTFILGVISLSVTGNIQQMTRITLSYIGIKHLLYILNEYLWRKSENLQERKWGER